jgi:glycosyltransferase involved in cell wall biosynthesis
MYEEVFRLVETLHLTSRVHFTGYLAAEELPSLYNLAEAFIYPSLYEGFGIPPLEAMACGVPVITTESSAMIETIGDAGLLVPPGDEQALSEAMEALLNDAELRARLSAKGLQRAKQFTWEHTARETLRVYEQALSRQ